MPRRALRAVALTSAFAVAGCGSDDAEQAGYAVPGGPVNVYVSVPAHGPQAAGGRAAAAGARLALRDARGRAGDRRVRLIRVSSTRPGDGAWDAGTVEANAKRAADDPRAIAYLGELDRGASAVSVPRTNGEDLLQVSPLDAVTSLTRRPRGRPRAGPERYYPSGRRTFVRLVPSDERIAEEMLAVAKVERGTRVALVDTPEFAPRELGAILDARVRREVVPVAHTVLKDDPKAVQDAVEEVAAERPDVVLASGEPGPVAQALLAQVARRLPRARVVASPGMASTPGRGSGAVAVTSVLPAGAYGAAAQRVRRRLGPAGRVEGLYGYDAMKEVLRAVRAGGGDRRAVARAGLAPGPRRGATGRYRVLRGGDTERARIALVPLDGGPARVRALAP